MLSLEDTLSFSLHVDKAGDSRHHRAIPPTGSTARCLKRLVSSVVYSFTAWVGRNGRTIEMRDWARKLSLVGILSKHWVRTLGPLAVFLPGQAHLHGCVSQISVRTEDRLCLTRRASSVGKPSQPHQDTALLSLVTSLIVLELFTPCILCTETGCVLRR